MVKSIKQTRTAPEQLFHPDTKVARKWATEIKTVTHEFQVLVKVVGYICSAAKIWFDAISGRTAYLSSYAKRILCLKVKSQVQLFFEKDVEVSNFSMTLSGIVAHARIIQICPRKMYRTQFNQLCNAFNSKNSKDQVPLDV